METYGYIYITTNKINNKRYVGMHKNKNFDTKYFGSGTLLKRAIKKYGKENFTCFPLAWAWNKEELDNLEIEYIAHYKPEYNIAKGGEGGSFPKTEEHKKRIGEANKGKLRSEESKLRMSEAHKGNKISEETIIKRTKSRKGYKHSEKTIMKISNALKGKHWYNNGIKNVFAFVCPDGFIKGQIRQVG